MTPTLELSDVAVSFGPASALGGVTLKVRPGTVTGISGNNGAGKSTLMHAVMGLVGMRRGRVLLHGEDVTGSSARRMVARGAGLVPEGRHVFTDQTVSENLRLGYVGRNGGSYPDAVERAMTVFPELATHLKRPAGALSGGQQQMLAIARALVASPSVLLLDEPFLGLAPVIVDRLSDSIVDLARTGMSVVVADAAARRVMGFCDFTYILRVGEVAAAGTTPELESLPVLHQLLLGGA